MTESCSLVVGAGGQVGTQLVQQLCARDGVARVLGTSRSPKDTGEAIVPTLQLDLSTLHVVPVSQVLERFHLGAIYCVGGMTHVDGCESQPELAYAANAHGPEALAGYAGALRIPFVYYSTEYVFAGTSDAPGPYTELSPVRPLNVYGRSKLEGENRVLDAHPGALVLRTTVVYGPDRQQKNFVYGLLRNLSQQIRMKVPIDQVSTPTYNRDLTTATLDLVASGARGIFHVCGPELLGRLDFAREVAQHLGLDAALLDGVSTSTLQQAAARPLDAGLSSAKLAAHLPQLHMRTVGEAIEECAEELRGSVGL